MPLNTRSSWNMITFNSTTKMCLTAILIVLPIQLISIGSFIEWGKGWLPFISYIDEITVAVFAPFAMSKYIREKGAFDQTLFLLLLPILLLSATGLVSGLINGNSFVVTVLGTIDYIKNLLVIFIYAAFFKDTDDFKKIFRYFIAIAVLLGACSFIQEFWALFSRYILEKDIMDITYLLTKNSMPENSWRFGIYRAPSISATANMVIYYSLFVLSMYFCCSKKTNLLVVVTILFGAVFSGSRSGYVALIVVLVLLIIKNMKMRFILVNAVIVLSLFSAFLHLNVMEVETISQFNEIETYSANDEEYVFKEKQGIFRSYTKKKSLEIWKDHPIVGVGPGMFGGIISIKTDSHIYEEYNVALLNNIRNWSGIDQYWAQILVEVGIIGFLSFAAFFIILSVILFLLNQKTYDDDLKGLSSGLMIVLAIIIIFTLASGLNYAPLVFSFSAFTGMALGCMNNDKRLDRNNA